MHGLSENTEESAVAARTNLDPDHAVSSLQFSLNVILLSRLSNLRIKIMIG